MAQSFVRPDAAVRVAHPAGATYLIHPTGSKELMAWRSAMRQKIRETGGSISDESAEGDGLDRATAEAIAMQRFDDLIEFAASKVKAVADVVDEETGDAIPSSPELVKALLEQIYEEPEGALEVDASSEVPAIETKKAQSMLTATWVINESARLGMARAKNS